MFTPRHRTIRTAVCVILVIVIVIHLAVDQRSRISSSPLVDARSGDSRRHDVEELSSAVGNDTLGHRSSGVTVRLKNPGWKPGTRVMTPARTGRRRRIREQRSDISRSVGVTAASEPHLRGSRGRRSADDGVWFDFSDARRRFFFYVYSAFFDDRSRPVNVVRIISISTPVDQLQRLNVTPTCLLHYANGTSIASTPTSPPADIGVGWPLHSIDAKEYIYGCPLPTGSNDDDVPLSVSVVPTGTVPLQQPPPELPRVPVEIPPRPATKDELAICVQIVYRGAAAAGPEVVRLVEWIELQRLLGASTIGLYLAPDVGVDFVDVLRHYSRVDGLVDLRRSDYIPPVDGRHESSSDQYLLHGSPVINDCIYRHMYRFRHIAVIDVDEVILPRQDADVLAMIRRLDGGNQSAAQYTFYNSYFFLDLDPDANETSNFTIVRYRRKVPLSPEWYAAKSIIVPVSCINMHNHLCWGFVKPGNSTTGISMTEILVTPDVAVLQHYKRCHFSPDECRPEMCGSNNFGTADNPDPPSLDPRRFRIRERFRCKDPRSIRIRRK